MSPCFEPQRSWCSPQKHQSHHYFLNWLLGRVTHERAVKSRVGVPAAAWPPLRAGRAWHQHTPQALDSGPVTRVFEAPLSTSARCPGSSLAYFTGETHVSRPEETPDLSSSEHTTSCWFPTWQTRGCHRTAEALRPHLRRPMGALKTP